MAEPRCRNDRNRKEKQRFSRLLAVTFSLFRHSPCGGSANATFHCWGKERTAANSPNVAAWLSCCCGGATTGWTPSPTSPPQSAKTLPDFRRGAFLCVGTALFFRSVARQVSSALVSLTAVFGMGTGGPSPLKAPTMVHLQGLEPWTP